MVPTSNEMFSGSVSWDADPVPRALTTDPMSVGSNHEEQRLPSQVTDTTNPHVPNFDIQTVTILGNELGRGSFGVCHKVRVPVLGICVMKLANQNHLQVGITEDELFRRRREFLHCIMLNHHPNIVSFYGYVHETGCPNEPKGILMEFMQGGSLSLYLQHDHPMPPEILNGWAKQIAQGLSFMHHRGIMHRDLNPNNILLSRDYHVAKISDFGLAKKQAADITYRNTVRVGTAIYRAPEVFVDNTYCYPVDVYSYGMTLYFIYYRRHPFEHDFFRGLSPFIAQKKLSGTESEQPIRPQLGLLGNRLATQDELIKMCWHSNPAKRPTILNVIGFFDQYSNELPTTDV